MFENEKKVMLTPDEYLSIVMLMCKGVSMYTQTNYYFDDDELSMNKKGITCRIREKYGKYNATVKNHNLKYSDCSVEVELEEKLEFNPLIFNVFGLSYKGKLVTERIVLYKDHKCEVSLDRNFYLGNTDFELEVEYCEGGEQKALSLIDNIAKKLVVNKHLTQNIQFLARIGKGSCKSQRFFAYLKKTTR